jgi:hypothetical protein
MEDRTALRLRRSALLRAIARLPLGEEHDGNRDAAWEEIARIDAALSK